MTTINKLKDKKYIILATILFILDFVITLYFVNNSPYAEEGNPLFNIDGGYLVLVLNLLYLLMVFILEKFIIRKYETILLNASGFVDYSVKLFKNEKSDFILTSFVYAFIIASLASRLVVIIDWIIFGIYHESFKQTNYSILKSKMPLGRFDPIISIITLLVAVIVWYYLEYQKSKKMFNSIQDKY